MSLVRISLTRFWSVAEAISYHSRRIAHEDASLGKGSRDHASCPYDGVIADLNPPKDRNIASQPAARTDPDRQAGRRLVADRLGNVVEVVIVAVHRKPLADNGLGPDFDTAERTEIKSVPEANEIADCGTSAQFGQSGCGTNPSVTPQRHPATDRDPVARQSLDQAARTDLAHPPDGDAVSAAKLHAPFDEHRLPAADKPARKRDSLTDDHTRELGGTDLGIDPVI